MIFASLSSDLSDFWQKKCLLSAAWGGAGGGGNIVLTVMQNFDNRISLVYQLFI